MAINLKLRSWSEFCEMDSFSQPLTSEISDRLNNNLYYFQANYLVLFVTFLGFVQFGQPIIVLLMIVMALGWIVIFKHLVYIPISLAVLCIVSPTFFFVMGLVAMGGLFLFTMRVRPVVIGQTELSENQLQMGYTIFTIVMFGFSGKLQGAVALTIPLLVSLSHALFRDCSLKAKGTNFFSYHFKEASSIFKQIKKDVSNESVKDEDTTDFLAAATQATQSIRSRLKHQSSS